MKNKIFIKLAILFLILFPLNSFAGEKEDLILLETSKGVVEIPVLFANTEQERRVGLMFKKDLGEYAGMLFTFDKEEEIAMWMKNTFISLDMVFFDEQGNVVNVVKETEPFSLKIISSKLPSKYVLELISGKADEFGIDTNSKIISTKNKNKLLQFEKK